jgi:hypothetical protein
MTEFEGLFMRTTLARYVQDWGWVDPDYLMGVSSRDRFNNVFNNIDDIARMPPPTFAYLHLLSPHPPFVFDPNGNPTYPPDFWNDQRMYPANLYEKGYLNQAQFLNKKVLQAVDTILTGPRCRRLSSFKIMVPVAGINGCDSAAYLRYNDQLYPTILPSTFSSGVQQLFRWKIRASQDVSYFSSVPSCIIFWKPSPAGSN